MLNKVIFVSFSIIALVLVISSIYLAWHSKEVAYKEEKNKLTEDIEKTKNEIALIKDTKDDLNYAPKDITVNFMNEIKSDSIEEAELYLTEQARSIELKKALKLEKDADKLTVTDVEQEINGDSATCNVSGFVSDESLSYSAVLTLVKENGVWRINKIN